MFKNVFWTSSVIVRIVWTRTFVELPNLVFFLLYNKSLSANMSCSSADSGLDVWNDFEKGNDICRDFFFQIIHQVWDYTLLSIGLIHKASLSFNGKSLWVLVWADTSLFQIFAEFASWISFLLATGPVWCTSLVKNPLGFSRSLEGVSNSCK